MINKLKKLVQKDGIYKVTMDLGYRSHATVYKWIAKKEIPSIAKEKVKNYLKGVK